MSGPKKTRKQIVDHFMEDFKKEFDQKVIEKNLEVAPSFREWIFIHYTLKLERMLEIVIRKNEIHL